MSICPSCRLALRRVLRPNAQQRRSYSTPANTAQKILASPTWSVRDSLLSPDSPSSMADISPKTLHHLLRLSALPLPRSSKEEASMIETLQSQLHFVQAVQRVDTEGVEPLTAIRDETEQGVRENTITLASLRPVLEREKLVGHYQRPKRVKEKRETGDEAKVEAERWDALGTASRKAGRFFVVQSKKGS